MRPGRLTLLTALVVGWALVRVQLGFDYGDGPHVVALAMRLADGDRPFVDEMNLLIQKIWMETKKTIAFVTHNVTEAIFLADRVFVLSPRPGRLAKVYRIDLPRPRTIEQTFTPEFIEMMLEIKAQIQHGGGTALGSR